jgi:hypothetical protein
MYVEAGKARASAALEAPPIVLYGQESPLVLSCFLSSFSGSIFDKSSSSILYVCGHILYVYICVSVYVVYGEFMARQTLQVLRIDKIFSRLLSAQEEQSVQMDIPEEEQSLRVDILEEEPIVRVGVPVDYKDLRLIHAALLEAQRKKAEACMRAPFNY